MISNILQWAWSAIFCNEHDQQHFTMSLVSNILQWAWKWSKVFYGQEPPSGESTATEYGVNYQLFAVYTEAAQFGTHSCSEAQPATDNGVRDGRSNWLVAPPTLMGSTPWAPRAFYKSVQPHWESNEQPQHARQPPCLCGHLGWPHVADQAHCNILQWAWSIFSNEPDQKHFCNWAWSATFYN